MAGRGAIFSRFFRAPSVCRITLVLFAVVLCAFPLDALAQDQREDEIIASLAGGRAIVHVAKDAIIFAAINQPVERNSIPPRVRDLEATLIGIASGASEGRFRPD